MDLFLLLISQIFDAFVENLNLFLIILDVLIEFLDLFLEFMLLTRFNILDWAVVAMNYLVTDTMIVPVVLSKVILLDWAVAEAVNVLVAVADAVNVLVAVTEAVDVLVACSSCLLYTSPSPRD